MDQSSLNNSTVTLKVTATSAAVSGVIAYNTGTNTVAFYPSVPLAYSTQYTLTISTGAKDLAGNGLASPATVSFTTRAQPDQTPPSVTGSNPANGATGVLPSALTVTFSEDMNSSTINTSTFTVTSNGNPVSGTVAYNSGTRVATFTPTTPFTTGQNVTATVTTGVQDLAGNAMSSNYAFSFTTPTGGGSFDVSGQPTFSGTTAADNVHLHLLYTQTGTDLTLAASCPYRDCGMFPINESGAVIVGPNTAGEVFATVVSGTGTLNGANLVFTFTLDNGRTFTYTATVTSNSTMTGTLSGDTQPAVALNMERAVGTP
jgi:hypothetical protein